MKKFMLFLLVLFALMAFGCDDDPDPITFQDAVNRVEQDANRLLDDVSDGLESLEGRCAGTVDVSIDCLVNGQPTPAPQSQPAPQTAPSAGRSAGYGEIGN